MPMQLIKFKNVAGNIMAIFSRPKTAKFRKKNEMEHWQMDLHGL